MDSLTRLVLVSISSLTAIAPIDAQELVGGQWDTLHQFDGQAAVDQLGSSVSSAGDVDGDGFDDVIMGADLADPGGLQDAGSAYIYSGATGTLIWQFDGQATNDYFGSSVSGAGDVDGDGFDDVIVGAPGVDPGGLWSAGSAYIYSGATGALLRQCDGQAAADYFGSSVSSAGDVDGDGFDDVIVGAPGADPGGLNGAGSAYVYSGATGTLIWQFDGQAWSDSLGYSVSGSGDVDGDGFDDVIVGAYGASPGGLQSAGSAYVYSGATGTLIWQFDGQAANDYLGHSVSGAGNVDGDGTPDVIVGALYADFGGLVDVGSAYIYSGATGALLWQFDGQAAGDQLGYSVSGAGNVDGDGFDDVIVGARRADPGGLTRAGSAYVFSLDPFLRLNADQISYSGNQLMQLDLDFPASEAGAHYMILLSTTGTGPSLLRGLTIPLTQDMHFQQRLGNATLHGALDANGQAQRSFRLHHAVQPGAIGRTFYLAAATFDTGTQAGRMSSVVRYLTITP